MSVPKQRHTKGSRDRGRKRYAVQSKNTQKCSNCSNPTLSHQVCPKCGYYKGKEVVNTMKKVKKEKKK